MKLSSTKNTYNVDKKEYNVKNVYMYALISYMSLKEV